ncbi:Aconitate hydratase A [Pseudolycoriella hygida]|uniref:(2R,3S)-2-methylisocitrate dehydratase n=1 Tax=Pseudolycoriella hygida TaxID=35572 RepID=A0A9Q0S638_9DIPT|nr:Aconitate hydratase A [Pseudolycoriella hygida]
MGNRLFSDFKSLDYVKEIAISGNIYRIFDINKAAKDIDLELKRLPYSLRILFENVLRINGKKESLLLFKQWLKNKKSDAEIPFMPARVLMQDFSGVPAIVDLAAMRDAVKKRGGNPLKINPLIPVDLVIDHSVQVDYYGTPNAFAENVKMEVQRNIERYRFSKWGQVAFDNFRVVPPGTGICHQVNLEYLSKIVWTKEEDGTTFAYPDSLVGTDSHTTMVNGVGVLGWGVGGIEAEAAMLGQPLSMILPEVIGVKLTGSLQGIITATDLVLTITQMLRKKNVIGKFVEFYGEGLDSLSIADRATISNMSPEFGATCGFFPTDNETIKYLHLTARDLDRIRLVEEYNKLQSLWREPAIIPEYTDILELDLTTLDTSLAGPKRPQDRTTLANCAASFKKQLPSLSKGNSDLETKYPVPNTNFAIGNGDVVIAAITSCTNTSNPSVMLAAGILAKKAIKAGLSTKPWVKTSLAPGSQVVTEYLVKSGLQKYLDDLGFNLVGYGCTTCIGNSGPLKPEIENTIIKNKLVAVSILSGNRNFEGRIHPFTIASYLASPPLVVAYALTGSINIDLKHDFLGKDQNGKDIYLKDIWPSAQEVRKVLDESLNAKMFKDKYNQVFIGDQEWQNIKVIKTDTYSWDKKSTYINNPPFFEEFPEPSDDLQNIKSARILAIFGDSVTTDHISPAGNISKTSPAAKYLIEQGIEPKDFNSYGSRRGNHEVMLRGAFANSRIKNLMCDGIEGGVTINQLNKQQMSIYDAAMAYKEQAIPLVIFAGKEYGCGSSRDWAAKATNLLGVKAVIAESFERIHRSNLVGMGVLPLILVNCTLQDLKLNGAEYITLQNSNKEIKPYNKLNCIIERKDGTIDTVELILQVFTDSEINYIQCGSIMHLVVRNFSK